MIRRTILTAVAVGCVTVAPRFAAAAPPSPLPGSAILVPGSAGSQVAVLQADLAGANDAPGPVDGHYGPVTRAAVRRLQAGAGIAVDGVVGPRTWSALHARLLASYHVNDSLSANGAKYGDVGQAVSTLQQDLARDGYDPGPVNGVYLRTTAQAVYSLERQSGLPMTMRVRGAVLSAIMGGGSRTVARPSSAIAGNTIAGHPVVGSMQLTATAYGPSLRDNYPFGPVDYFGRPLVAGDVAVDPGVIPLGSLLWVYGYRTPMLPAGGFLARAVDTGGAIQGDRIDIYIGTSDAQLSRFGIQKVQVKLLGR